MASIHPLALPAHVALGPSPRPPSVFSKTFAPASGRLPSWRKIGFLSSRLHTTAGPLVVATEVDCRPCAGAQGVLCPCSGFAARSKPRRLASSTAKDAFSSRSADRATMALHLNVIPKTPRLSALIDCKHRPRVFAGGQGPRRRRRGTGNPRDAGSRRGQKAGGTAGSRRRFGTARPRTSSECSCAPKEPNLAVSRSLAHNFGVADLQSTPGVWDQRLLALKGAFGF